MSSLLSAQALTKSYGTQALFKNISFTLVQGDRVGLVGPNGAGKSTLLKILMDLESPDAGSIARRQGLGIGYASQAPEFPSMPLEELLMEGAPGDEIERRTRARVLLGKAQFANFTVNAAELSGGWKKRLDIV